MSRGFSVARPLENIRRQYGDRLRIVELQPARAPFPRHVCCHEYQKSFLFPRGKVHPISYLSFLGGTGASPTRKRLAAVQKSASVAGIRYAEALSPFTTTPSEVRALAPHIVHPVATREWRFPRCRSSSSRSAADRPPGWRKGRGSRVVPTRRSDDSIPGSNSPPVARDRAAIRSRRQSQTLESNFAIACRLDRFPAKQRGAFGGVIRVLWRCLDPAKGIKASAGIPADHCTEIEVVCCIEATLTMAVDPGDSVVTCARACGDLDVWMIIALTAVVITMMQPRVLQSRILSNGCWAARSQVRLPQASGRSSGAHSAMNRRVSMLAYPSSSSAADCSKCNRPFEFVRSGYGFSSINWLPACPKSSSLARRPVRVDSCLLNHEIFGMQDGAGSAGAIG